MKAHSAGLVVYRLRNGQPEVLLGHIGGPWRAKQDLGAWSIPKGLIEEGEDPLGAAKREFIEELSLPVPEGKFIELGDIEQHNNKIVTAWAIEADIDVGNAKSNTFEVEWPPKSGQMREFPETDRVDWFSLSVAVQKVVKGQAELFERLAQKIGVDFDSAAGQQASLF
jgi:predicted NUDIX family NTP pyrophosphohydrolase